MTARFPVPISCSRLPFIFLTPLSVEFLSGADKVVLSPSVSGRPRLLSLFLSLHSRAYILMFFPSSPQPPASPHPTPKLSSFPEAFFPPDVLFDVVINSVPTSGVGDCGLWLRRRRILRRGDKFLPRINLPCGGEGYSTPPYQPFLYFFLPFVGRVGKGVGEFLRQAH